MTLDRRVARRWGRISLLAALAAAVPATLHAWSSGPPVAPPGPQAAMTQLELAPPQLEAVGNATATQHASRSSSAFYLGVDSMPRPDTVGVPKGLSLRTLSSSQVVGGGVYDGVVIPGGFQLPKGSAPVTLSNCLIQGSIVIFAPVYITSCTITGGIFAYDTGGSLTSVLVDSDANQAFRPGTSSTAGQYTIHTPWVVTDTYLRIRQGVPPNHTEASQVLGGVGIRFDNVVFDTGGPFNNTQTADLNFIGKDMVCQDCFFVGYGGYSVYSEGSNNVFIRPHWGTNAQWGTVWPGSKIKPTIIDPRNLDGTPR